MFAKLALIGTALFYLGCRSNPIPLSNPVKDTGWVTVLSSDYLYHKSLEWPDGENKEFFTCDPQLSGVQTGDVIRISYTGNGQTMDECASNVSYVFKNPLVDGHRIEQHTVPFKYDGSTLYLTQSKAECGTIRNINGAWEAFAYEDNSREHYFKTEKQAVEWLTTNWCRP